MKVVICGSRSIKDTDYVRNCIEQSRLDITEVISGGAGGVDTIAYWWAQLKGIPCTMVRAEWRKHGRSAGVIRNHEMVKVADAVIVIWDGVSLGTKNTISQARIAGKPVELWRNAKREVSE